MPLYKSGTWNANDQGTTNLNCIRLQCFWNFRNCNMFIPKQEPQLIHDALNYYVSLPFYLSAVTGVMREAKKSYK